MTTSGCALPTEIVYNGATMRVAKDLLLYDSTHRPCIGIEEAARRRGISAWGLRKRIKAGDIEFVIAGGRKVIPVDVIEKFQPDRAKSERAKAHPPFSRKERKPRKRPRDLPEAVNA